jgi:hypothetical protein
MSWGAKEIETLISNLDGEETGYSNAWSAIGYEDIDFPIVLSEIPFYAISGVVESVGGYEGAGETRYVVIEIETPEGWKFYRKDGAYYSFDGTHWDGSFYEVEPKEKTIKIYEKVAQ